MIIRILSLLSCLLLPLSMPALADNMHSTKSNKVLNQQLNKVFSNDKFTDAEKMAEAEKLIAKGADVNVTTNVFSPLMAAVYSQSAKIVEFLIFKGANPKEKGLMAAVVYADSVEKAKILLDQGADPNDEDELEKKTPIYKVKSLAMAELLIAKGANLNHHNDLWTALSYVAGANDVLSPDARSKVVKLFIAKGAAISGDAANELLFTAAATGDMDMMDHLVAHGADVNTKNNRDETPLFAAAGKGQLKAVKWLVNKGADVNATSIHEQTPLGLTRDVSIAEVLLDKGASPNGRCMGMPYPMAVAFYQYNSDLIRLLVERGADINAKDPVEQTILFKAAEHSDIGLVKFLVKKGADVNAQDRYGDTPLSGVMDNEDMVDILMENGADPNRLNANNQSPFMRAVKNAAILKVMIDKGSDIHQADGQNSTLMHHAAQEGIPEVVDILLKAGLDINARNNAGKSPIRMAFEAGRPDMIQYLLDKGARLNPKEENEFEFVKLASPLGPGNEEKAAQMLHILVSQGFNINAQDAAGNTMLHLAVDVFFPEPVKILLDNGANPNAVNANGDTPLHRVQSGMNPGVAKPIIQALLDRGARINARNKAGVLAKKKVDEYMKIRDTAR